MSGIQTQSTTVGSVLSGGTGPPARAQSSAPGIGIRTFRWCKPRSWKRIPFPLFLLILWGSLRWSNVDLPFGSVLGFTLISLSFGIVILEFLKSGDIAVPSFVWDLTMSVIATLAYTAVAVLLWKSGTFYVADIFIGLAVLIDAIVSPTNAFKMALRNVQAGIAHGSHDPVQ